jgi:hypothetical protein
MINELFNEINRDKLSDWGVILLGVSGVPGIAERLSRSVVVDFASAELEKISIDDPILDLVVEMAMDSGETSNELREKLEEICQAKKIDLGKSTRKWRFIAMRSILSDLDADPVYGLIKLSEFWTAWGWPSDTPSSLRSDAKVSPQDYHSQSNYEYVIQNHREWLEEELRSLQ